MSCKIQHLLKHPQPIANIWFTVMLESCNTAGLVELKYLIASLNLIKKFNSDAGRAFAVLKSNFSLVWEAITRQKSSLLIRYRSPSRMFWLLFLLLPFHSLFPVRPRNTSEHSEDPGDSPHVAVPSPTLPAKIKRRRGKAPPFPFTLWRRVRLQVSYPRDEGDFRVLFQPAKCNMGK